MNGALLAALVVGLAVAFVACVLAAAFVVVRRFGPREAFSTLPVTPGRPFGFDFTIPRDGDARLWLYFDAEVDVEIRPPRTRRMQDYVGIDGEAWTKGVRLAAFSMHTGTVCPPSKRTVGVAFHVTRVDARSPGSLRETLRVARLPGLSAGEVVTVRGIVVIGDRVRPRRVELRVSL